MFDSQHWYARDGAPAHSQGARPTTLRDARKLNLLPSVSTVLSVIAKPALTQWQVKQGILAALTTPRGNDDEETYLRRVMQDGRQEAQDAAREGTAIHAAIEASFAGESFPSRFRPHVSAVRSILSDNFNGVTDWTIERRFACREGFGGMVDIHSRSIRRVGDHKGSTCSPDAEKRLAYEQHFQLGGYSIGLDLEEDVRGFNLFVSRTHPGYVVFHEWPAEKMQEGQRVFRAALKLWSEMKGYSGAFA